MADIVVPYTEWGVQPGGFVTPSLRDILAKIEGDQKSLISADFDVDPDSPDGINNGIFAGQCAKLWQVAELIHDAHNRDNATGELLTDLGKLTGTARKPARSTVVVATCTLTAGTELEPDVSFAYPLDRPTDLFTPVAAYTADVDGEHLVPFQAVETGPTVVAAGELSVIASPTTGWTAVTNTFPGTTGRAVETEEQFRLSQEADLARAGASTTAAIAIDLLDLELTGVVDCKCYANLSSVDYDDSGRPPGAVEIVFEIDGTQDDQAIAAAIWSVVPAGRQTFGSEHATTLDEHGDIQDVYWSTITSRPVYITYTLTTGAGYVGDAAVSEYVASEAQRIFDQSADVISLRVKALPLDLEGVTDVTGFALGFTEGPTTDANLPIGVRERAAFAAARVVLT